MYQGLRVVGGLLVVLGIVFPVLAGFVALEWQDRMRAADEKSREQVSAAAWKLTARDAPDQKGNLESPAGEAYKKWMEQYDQTSAQSTQPMREIVSLYYLAVGMIDLAVIGLGLGLRATADMAEKLARVGIKKPA